MDKARRENGLIGTAAEWAWHELTGANSSSLVPNTRSEQNLLGNDDSDSEYVRQGEGDTVPQPAEDETAEDSKKITGRVSFSEHDDKGGSRKASLEERQAQQKGVIESVFDWFRPGPAPPAQSAPTSKKTAKALRRAQTVRTDEEEVSEDAAEGVEETTSNPTMRPHLSGSNQPSGKRPVATKGDSYINNETGELQAPPKTSIFESAGDILHPPMPSRQWITDPGSRARTIFHDRVYHPEDIPPPPIKRPGSRLGRSFSNDGLGKNSVSSRDSIGSVDSVDSGGMKVEEKIARAYHRDLSWRKVLVRLEPDAHNNMIVRRMFANAYGWPVVKHLCDTHFADTYSARTRDEAEPAKERAPPLEAPIDSGKGEEVQGQTTLKPPKRTESETREAQDELTELHGSKQNSLNSKPRLDRAGSAVWDDALFEGPDDDDSDIDERGFMQRMINPHRAKKPEEAPADASPSSSTRSPSTPYTDGHRGLAPISPSSTKSPRSASGSASLKTPPAVKSTFDAADVERPVVSNALVEEPETMDSPGSLAEVGLRKSISEQLSPSKSKSKSQQQTQAGTV